MDVLGLPSNNSRQLVNAVKKHLPVAELKINQRRVLVDCELLRRRPELIVKLTILLQENPKKRAIAEKPPKVLGKPVRKIRRTCFHQKYPGSLEVARSLIMTGVSGEEEAVAADPRRREGLGMAEVRIRNVLSTMRTLLPAEEVPGYRTLRRWMHCPNKQRQAARKYHNLIPAKLAVKVCSVDIYSGEPILAQVWGPAE